MAARQVVQSDVAKLMVGHLPQALLVAPHPQTLPLRSQETPSLRQEGLSQTEQRVALRAVDVGNSPPQAGFRSIIGLERNIPVQFSILAFQMPHPSDGCRLFASDRVVG